MRIKIKGFTLIELVIVIVILGLLAVATLPRFSSLENEAREAAARGVVGSFRAAVAIVRATWLAKGKPTPATGAQIEIEGIDVYVYTTGDTSGYPVDAGGSGTQDTDMTVDKCLNVFNNILKGPPEADDTCTSATCEVKVTATAATCKYTFDKGPGSYMEYTPETGVITYTVVSP